MVLRKLCAVGMAAVTAFSMTACGLSVSSREEAGQAGTQTAPKDREKIETAAGGRSPLRLSIGVTVQKREERRTIRSSWTKIRASRWSTQF